MRRPLGSARSSTLGGTCAFALLLAACGAGPLGEGVAVQARGGGPEGNPARIEVRNLAARPRLTLVARDGDPEPAVAAVFATGLGPAATTALAAVMETRVRAAGFEVETRVDRDAFRLRLALPDAARAEAMLAALAGAVARPVAAGSPEIAAATQRLISLKRNPLDAAELGPIALCTGALGILPGEAVLDPATDAGLRELEAARRAALHPTRIALAAVGPAAAVAAVAQAMERSTWPAPGPAAEEAAPADAAGVYIAPALDRRTARLSLAVRVPDPEAAAAAAERLGAADSALLSRLRTLPEAWRVTQIAGVARPRGGCVAITLEATRGPGQPVEPAAALAAAVARREILAEIGAGGGAASRQILAAADPGDAAARAAWWSLAASSPGPVRTAVALGVAAGERSPREPATPAASAARFQSEWAAALAVSTGAERRLSVERGQGELWLLLASPCGSAEETSSDAGLGAVAVMAAVEARRRGDVTLEPWITADGLGIVAHAPFRDDRESAADLARRVADAAARALTATAAPPESIAAARTAVLDHLERTAGHQGAAFDALAPALSPDHPSWLDPFGAFRRVAEAVPESVRARAQSLAFGPLRLSVIGNADAAQAAAAADAVDRWLTPAPGPRTCRAAPPSPGRGGHTDVRMPDGAPLAQGLLGAPFPPASPPGSLPYPYRELADLTAAALDGPAGLLAPALAPSAATAGARVLGGARVPALLVDVRAPDGNLAAAVGEAKALLLRLPAAATDADLARAAAVMERRELLARTDPRRRLADLWTGRRAAPPARPSLTAWRAFLTATLREPALAIVEARAQ
jgi:hypothetical protein